MWNNHIIMFHKKSLKVVQMSQKIYLNQLPTVYSVISILVDPLDIVIEAPVLLVYLSVTFESIINYKICARKSVSILICKY